MLLGVYQDVTKILLRSYYLSIYGSTKGCPGDGRGTLILRGYSPSELAIVEPTEHQGKSNKTLPKSSTTVLGGPWRPQNHIESYKDLVKS